VVPKPSGPPFRGGEFGLPIYLLVDFLALLLVIASNTTLTTQPSNLLCHKPNPYPLWFFLSLFPSLVLPHPSLCVCQPLFHSPFIPFYSLPLARTQMITSSPFPMWPYFCPESLINWSILKILLKLATNTKQLLVADSPKALTTFSYWPNIWLSSLRLFLARSLTLGWAQFNNSKLSPSTDLLSAYYGYWARSIPMGVGQH